MSLLVSFIRFLNEDELASIRKMPLAGKEKRVMQTIMQQPIMEEISKPEMLKSLGLSSSHYDKIGTVLLKKAYKALAGDDELEQLNFLSKKFMFRHLFHEIRHLYAKVTAQQMHPAERERYASALFNFSINVPAKYFDEQFVDRNAALYLDNMLDNKPAKELEVRAKILFARLNKLTQQAPDPRATGKILKEVTDLEVEFTELTAIEPKTVLYHVLINYYRLVEINADRRIYYLGKIAELYNGYSKMPAFEQLIAECHFAEIYYERGQYEEAYKRYKLLFGNRMDSLKNQFHHFARCIELAIVLNDFPVAHRMLDSLFRVYIANRHESTGVLGAILYGQLYLKSGELDKAYEYISIAKSLNSIQVYFHYEIRIRMLETLFFAFHEDFDFVSRLAQRNIRYIQLQKLSLKKYKNAHFFYLLKDIRNIKRLYPDRLPPKINAYLKEFQDGYEILLGQLLQKLLTVPEKKYPA